MCEYHRMIEAGLLHEDDRVELINGKIIEMTPIGGPRVDVVDVLPMRFAVALGERATASARNLRPGRPLGP